MDAVAVAEVVSPGDEYFLAGDTPVLTPIVGELIVPLIADASTSGEDALLDVPTPTGETPVTPPNMLEILHSSAIGMDMGEVVTLGVERLCCLSLSLCRSKRSGLGVSRLIFSRFVHCCSSFTEGQFTRYCFE